MFCSDADFDWNPLGKPRDFLRHCQSMWYSICFNQWSIRYLGFFFCNVASVNANSKMNKFHLCIA